MAAETIGQGEWLFWEARLEARKWVWSGRLVDGKSGKLGWTDSSPCYPLVLVNELGSGLKSEVTAISLSPENYAWLHLPRCTKEVQQERFKLWKAEAWGQVIARGLCFHQGPWLPVQLVRKVPALMQLYQKDLKGAMMEELGLEKQKEPAGGGEAEAEQPTGDLTKHPSKFGKGPKRWLAARMMPKQIWDESPDWQLFLLDRDHWSAAPQLSYWGGGLCRRMDQPRLGLGQAHDRLPISRGHKKSPQLCSGSQKEQGQVWWEPQRFGCRWRRMDLSQELQKPFLTLWRRCNRICWNPLFALHCNRLCKELRRSNAHQDISMMNFAPCQGAKAISHRKNHGQDFGAAGSWRLCRRRGTDQGQFLVSYLAKLPAMVPVMSYKSSVTIQCNLHKLVAFTKESF